MKHVRILWLGGATIAGTDVPGKRVDLSDYIRSMHEFDGRIKFSFANRTDIAAGYMMQISDIVEASAEIRRAVHEDGADGVVVIMGTDCMEEGAFGFDLLAQDVEAPVVVTGGMRVATARGADGPGNLYDAINAAASDELRGMGVTVVLNNWIHSAQYVQKTHPSNNAAFTLEFPLGMVIEGDVSIRNRPVRRFMPWIQVKTPPKNVLLQYCYLGIDGKVFDHVEEDGYDGLVVAGTGGCDVAVPVFDRLEKLRRKHGASLPIVIGTRIGRGEPLASTYGDFVGSPSYIRKNYLVTGQLDCLKARLLLTFLLMSECSPQQIRDSFQLFDRSISK